MKNRPRSNRISGKLNSESTLNVNNLLLDDDSIEVIDGALITKFGTDWNEEDQYKQFGGKDSHYVIDA